MMSLAGLHNSIWLTTKCYYIVNEGAIDRQSAQRQLHCQSYGGMLPNPEAKGTMEVGNNRKHLKMISSAKLNFQYHAR